MLIFAEDDAYGDFGGWHGIILDQCLSFANFASLSIDIIAIKIQNYKPYMRGAWKEKTVDVGGPMSFDMKGVPSEKVPGWEVKIDGEVRRVGLVEVSSKFGTLTYGLRPEGYDSWVFRETGGGGAVTLPYAMAPDGSLLVGLLLEKRPNMGEVSAWCVIGGFVNPNESHVAAQTREGTEESGLDTAQAGQLPGLGTNSNRAFFVADATTEGVKAYGLIVPFGSLEPEGNGFKLKPDTQMLDPKKVANVRFFPWKDAVRLTADALARSAIAQLLTAVL